MLNKLIDVTTSDRIGEKEFSGICILHTSEVLMLLNFNEETAEFDGFSLLRNEDFEAYSEWEEEDFEEIKKDNSKALIGDINPEDYSTFELALKKRQSTLVAVFNDEDLDSYYVGRVEGLKDDMLTLHLINEEAEWIETISLSLSSIWYIGFGTTYENELMKNAL